MILATRTTWMRMMTVEHARTLGQAEAPPAPVRLSECIPLGVAERLT
jgi:hypothetical protein